MTRTNDVGLLTVSAFHVGYGSNAFNLTIDGDSGRLTEEEIKTMLENAEEHANTDKELRENLEAKQSLESYCFQLKNYVTDPQLDEASETDLEGIADSLESLIEMIDDTSG